MPRDAICEVLRGGKGGGGDYGVVARRVVFEMRWEELTERKDGHASGLISSCLVGPVAIIGVESGPYHHHRSVFLGSCRNTYHQCRWIRQHGAGVGRRLLRLVVFVVIVAGDGRGLGVAAATASAAAAATTTAAAPSGAIPLCGWHAPTCTQYFTPHALVSIPHEIKRTNPLPSPTPPKTSGPVPSQHVLTNCQPP